MPDKSDLCKSALLACDWLVDTAQVKDNTLTIEKNSLDFKYASWAGAMRGEYSVADKSWDFFCPVWHTGQAIKALLTASDLLGEMKYLKAASDGVDFITANQVWDKSSPDHGLITAYEDFSDMPNTSAILECMDGLILQAEREDSEDLWQRIIAAGELMVDRLYMPGTGHFRDVYNPEIHSALLPNPYTTKNDIGGRPLLDDGIWLKLYIKTHDQKFLDVHMAVAEALVKEQNPPGNWADYAPCNAKAGCFHPRHTYWWSLPLIDTYAFTGRKEFLDVAIASGEFCLSAMRSDGGWIRGLYLDAGTGCLKTESFGHATSGSACAAILFMELFKHTDDHKWLQAAEKAISFCRRMQFTDTEDINLRGAILERVLPPDGTDRSPYHIRDLGTIFYIMAAAKYIDLVEGRCKMQPVEVSAMVER
ncbi:MAG TPA: hypothetical protein DCL60_12165 [Armatimonadetes bacterium]|nr:hypothetical protein [Armatimonadota bacterium]